MRIYVLLISSLFSFDPNDWNPGCLSEECKQVLGTEEKPFYQELGAPRDSILPKFLLLIINLARVFGKVYS